MPTVDEEFLDATLKFIEQSQKAGKPFFTWFNSTRTHVWTHLKKESYGKSGVSINADGMLELDGMVGKLLQKLDDLKIADNTIVIFTTDNGAETVSWPDGGCTPFRSEKGTTWEGGHRIPLLVRWPGVLPAGDVNNGMIAHNDWMPTLLAAAGEPSIVEKLKQGYSANGRTFKIHADGYNLLPYFKGEAKKSPREEYLYFGQGGELNAVRWNDWKVHFASIDGNIATGTRKVTNWPLIVNLRADPYEKAPSESGLYIKWYAENIWLFEPIQQKVKAFFADFEKFPYQAGSSLNAAGINYQTLKMTEALKTLQQLESIAPPR
jgi:arylsulfatase